jgi:hypothetical protein
MEIDRCAVLQPDGRTADLVARAGGPPELAQQIALLAEGAIHHLGAIAGCPRPAPRQVGRGGPA